MNDIAVRNVNPMNSARFISAPAFVDKAIIISECTSANLFFRALFR